MVTIPVEGPYSEVELDLIDNEPPGLFPQSQSTLWGQMRKLFADYLQENFVDLYTQWYSNLDPRTVDITDIEEWEVMVGIYAHSASLTLDQRRQGVLARLKYGVFTRSVRQAIVESFVSAVLGDATSLTPSGVDLSSGVTLFSGATSTAGLYSITEDIPNFHYDIVLSSSAAVDIASLTRALSRVTPAHISFTVSNDVTPVFSTFGTGTYGQGTYGQ